MVEGGFILRLTVLGLLIAASFVFPLLWLVVLFGFGFILEWGKAPNDAKAKPDPRIVLQRYISAGDPQWRQNLERRCESPAEIAFLKAAIDAFGLRPEAGVLQGSGLRLDLQVDVPPYRADFLAQDWLVIEIDGAAWHSSADAVERDRKRDDFMQNQGYRVVRLPAKLVFSVPGEALARVRAALAEGRPTVERQTDWQPQQIPGSGLGKISGALHILNENISEIKAVRQALAEPESTFDLERRVIESSIEFAARKAKIDNYIGNDPLKRASFDAHTRNLGEAFKKYDAERSGLSVVQSAENTRIPAMTAPAKHQVDAIDCRIQGAYQHMLGKRSLYLAEQRKWLGDERSLCPLVQARLAELGCPQIWTLIAPPPDHA